MKKLPFQNDAEGIVARLRAYASLLPPEAVVVTDRRARTIVEKDPRAGGREEEHETKYGPEDALSDLDKLGYLLTLYGITMRLHEGFTGMKRKFDAYASLHFLRTVRDQARMLFWPPRSIRKAVWDIAYEASRNAVRHELDGMPPAKREL